MDLKKVSNPKFLEHLQDIDLREIRAGGIRTLVQTSNCKAFYMLSLCSVFDGMADQKPPITPLASLGLRSYRSRKNAMLTFMVLLKRIAINKGYPRNIQLSRLAGLGLDLL